MILINRLLAVLFSLVFIQSLMSQGIGNSPYSRYGIGDVLMEGTVRNQGIGGAGVGLPDYRFINFQNPALLSFNNVVGFEGGLLYQYKTMKTSTESQRAVGATPSYGIFAFPITKHWTSSLGIRPSSIISFQRLYSETVVGDSSNQLLVNETGNGGINTVFFGNGIEIRKNLSIGAEASYGFGRREVESRFGLNQIDPFFQNVLVKRENYRGFGYKLGAFYSIKLDSIGRTALGIGLTYKSNIDYNTDVFISGQTQALGLSLTEDTFLTEGYITKVPQSFTLGIGLKRANAWGVSLDINYTPWSQFDSNFENPKGINVLNYRLGLEYVPNYRSVSSVFARSIYRMGLYYDPFMFELDQGTFDEIGMNFGMSMPINKINFLNIGLTIGRRGTLENNLILENFARVSFGFTINDPNWFRRFKLD